MMGEGESQVSEAEATGGDAAPAAEVSQPQTRAGSESGDYIYQMGQEPPPKQESGNVPGGQDQGQESPDPTASPEAQEAEQQQKEPTLDEVKQDWFGSEDGAEKGQIYERLKGKNYAKYKETFSKEGVPAEKQQEWEKVAADVYSGSPNATQEGMSQAVNSYVEAQTAKYVEDRVEAQLQLEAAAFKDMDAEDALAALAPNEVLGEDGIDQEELRAQLLPPPDNEDPAVTEAREKAEVLRLKQERQKEMVIDMIKKVGAEAIISTLNQMDMGDFIEALFTGSQRDGGGRFGRGFGADFDALFEGTNKNKFDIKRFQQEAKKLAQNREITGEENQLRFGYDNIMSAYAEKLSKMEGSTDFGEIGQIMAITEKTGDIPTKESLQEKTKLFYELIRKLKDKQGASKVSDHLKDTFKELGLEFKDDEAVSTELVTHLGLCANSEAEFNRVFGKT